MREETGSRRVGPFINQRKFVGDKLAETATRITTVHDSAADAGNVVTSVPCVSLSKDPGFLLAILQAEQGYVVHIKDVENDALIYSLPRSYSLCSSVTFPDQWVGHTFFFKSIPKENSSDGAYVLSCLDTTTLQIKDLSCVKLNNISDIFRIGQTRIAQVSFLVDMVNLVRLSKWNQEPLPTKHALTIYDFWR